MTQNEILLKIVTPLLDKSACDLVSLEVKGSPSNRIFRFFVDHEDGITIRECASLSRSILDRLERVPEDFPPDSYRIEVSSPGVQRPLKIYKDFKRKKGKNVIIHLKDDESQKQVEGKIIEVNEKEVQLENDNQIKNIKYSTIQKAHVKINWS